MKNSHQKSFLGSRELHSLLQYSSDIIIELNIENMCNDNNKVKFFYYCTISAVLYNNNNTVQLR